MKKNNSKKSSKSRQRERSSEDAALNRELGTFGLEPPKIYRGTQTDPLDDYASLTSKRPNRRAATPQSFTPQEKRKQQNQSRKRSQLKRKIIFYLALAISICALVVVLSLTVLFKIHTINIEGNKVYTQKEILTVLPIQKDANLFLTDIDSAEVKLEESLPYVYNAEIKRKLPSSITVTITETPKVYCINNGDKSFTYLDDNFKVLETNAAKIPSGAVEIKKVRLVSKVEGKTAEFEDSKTGSNLKTIAQSVSKLNIDKITALYSDDINNNYVEYDKRIVIKLGSLDNIEKKLYSALSATDRLNETNPDAKGVITATNDKQVYFTAKK